jgi:sulfatase modifying factor 1
MRQLRHALFLASVSISLTASPVIAVTIAWSPVGNPGNAGDPANGPVPGAVAYNYNIGTYDVTNSQYVEFLNVKDATGTSPLGLYNSNMRNPTYGGINYIAGNANGNKYSVISGTGDHPVNYETWYDAVRFANWLNNGQGNGDTESGAYTLLGGAPTPSNANSITRNAGATVFLPSEDEWYKAAYYDPRTTAQGGPPLDSHYWLYPTSSNTTPTASSPTALPNHANFDPGGPLNLTDVGAYSGTTSLYGAFDMGGNVWQWNEALIGGSSRGVRGGSSFNGSYGLWSLNELDHYDPWGELNGLGFRVASTPEPSTGVLAVIGLMGLAAWRWRRRRA